MIIGIRACGHTAETAKASANAGDRMRRRKAGIGLGSREMREVEGIGLAADKRPAAPDDPFDDLAGEHRHQHRQKQKLQTRPETRAAGIARLPRKRGDDDSDRKQHRRQEPQHISRLAEIGQDADRPQAGGAARRHQADLASHRTANISTMIDAAPMPISSNAWRANRRAASARRECDGGRTSCASDSRNSAKSCAK